MNKGVHESAIVEYLQKKIRTTLVIVAHFAHEMLQFERQLKYEIQESANKMRVKTYKISA